MNKIKQEEVMGGATLDGESGENLPEKGTFTLNLNDKQKQVSRGFGRQRTPGIGRSQELRSSGRQELGLLGQ